MIAVIGGLILLMGAPSAIAYVIWSLIGREADHLARLIGDAVA